MSAAISPLPDIRPSNEYGPPMAGIEALLDRPGPGAAKVIQELVRAFGKGNIAMPRLRTRASPAPSRSSYAYQSSEACCANCESME